MSNAAQGPQDWLVYDADHVAEHSLHETEEQARRQAMAQARAHHGHQFHVFHFVHGYLAEADAPAPAIPAEAGAQ